MNNTVTGGAISGCVTLVQAACLELCRMGVLRLRSRWCPQRLPPQVHKDGYQSSLPTNDIIYRIVSLRARNCVLVVQHFVLHMLHGFPHPSPLFDQ